MAKKNTPKRTVQTAPAARLQPAVTNILPYALALAGLAILLYINTLGHDYVLDDPLAITKNAQVQKGFSGIPALLSSNYRAGVEGENASVLLYRPLSLVTFAMEWAIAPNSAFLNHLMQVLWFAGTAVLLFFTLGRLFRGYHFAWAFGTALLFTVHPIHTEVVANIKSRDEILCLFFGVAALYAWMRQMDTPSTRWRALSLGAYLLALLSKESAVTIWPVFPLAAWCFLGKNMRESAREALWMAVPVVVFLLLRSMVFSKYTSHATIDVMDNPIIAAHGFGERAATGFAVLGKYLQLLLWPNPLLSDYSYNQFPVRDWDNALSLFGLVAFVGLSGYAVWGLRRRQVLAFCTAAFLCAIVLYSQLLVVIGTLLGERLLYLPSLWFCAGVVLILAKATGVHLQQSSFAWKSTSIILVGLIAVAFAYQTISRNADWKNNLTLFAADSAKAPASVRLHNGLSTECYNSASEKPAPPDAAAWIQQSEDEARKAIHVKPNPISYVNLGNVALYRKRYDLAVQWYDSSLALVPTYGLAQTNRAFTYRLWGRSEGQEHNNPARATELLEKAVAGGQQDADVYLDLGTAYGMIGNNEKAIVNFEAAVKLDPGKKMAWRNLSVAYRAVGNVAKAEECERRAAQ